MKIGRIKTAVVIFTTVSLMCVGALCAVGANETKGEDPVHCGIIVKDNEGERIANLSVTITPANPANTVTVRDDGPAKTTGLGYYFFTAYPGKHTVIVSDPKQDWILGDKAPSQEFEIDVQAPEGGGGFFPTLIWDQTTPDEFSATIKNKAVFCIVEPDGKPVMNREVYLDYQENKGKPDFGKVAGGYTDKNGMYTYLKPLKKDITLIVKWTDWSTHDITLPTLYPPPGAEPIKVVIPYGGKKNPA